MNAVAVASLLSDEIADCIIVGGGPAGLSAAIYLARFLRRCVVIDAGQTRSVNPTVTQSARISGRDWRRRIAGRHGAAS